MAMIERQFDDGVQAGGDGGLSAGDVEWTPALANNNGSSNNRPSQMVGMRGGLDGPGAASEPIAGLAAFGSQSSMMGSSSSAAMSRGPHDNNTAYHPHRAGHGVASTTGSSRLSAAIPPAQHEMMIRAQAEAAYAAGGRGGGAGEAHYTSSRDRRNGGSAQRPGEERVRSNSPYRGGTSRSHGASSPGERARASRDRE